MNATHVRRALKLTPQENADVATLTAELIADGYSFCACTDDFYVYRVEHNGNKSIGVGPVEGEAVLCLDNGFPALNLDDSNVRYDDGIKNYRNRRKQ